MLEWRFANCVHKATTREAIKVYVIGPRSLGIPSARCLGWVEMRITTKQTSIFMMDHPDVYSIRVVVPPWASAAAVIHWFKFKQYSNLATATISEYMHQMHHHGSGIHIAYNMVDM